MKKGKLYTILIAVAFLLTVLLSCVCLRVVKRIEITYSLSEETEISYFDEEINKRFKGKLSFFITENKVRDKVEEYPYFTFIELSKRFPNHVSLKVEVRRETYLLNVEGDKYLLDKNGFVLSKNATKKQNFELIELNATNIAFNKLEIGKKIETDCDSLVFSVFDMAKSVNLSDNIKSVEIESEAFDVARVIFTTHTGVEIEVGNPFESGVEQTVFAFANYDEKADDYQKTYSKILVYIENGEIKTTWTERG